MISIIVLAVLSFVSIISKVGWFYLEFVDINSFKQLLANISYKLPVILPVLWMAIFSTKRRSEAARLQQEYAHKEAIVKSYQSFRQQIEGLERSDPEMSAKLIDTALDTVAKNASDTLDKNHGDKTPVHNSVEETITLVSKLKNMFKQ